MPMSRSWQRFRSDFSSQCVPDTLSAAGLQALQQQVDPVAQSFPASLRSCLQAVGDLQSAAQLLLLTVHSALLEAGLHLVQVSRGAASVFRVPLLVQLALPRAACPVPRVAAPGVLVSPSPYLSRSSALRS